MLSDRHFVQADTFIRGSQGSVKCCSGMAPEHMHNVEGLLAVAPSRRGTSRGNCCLAPLLVNMFFFFFSHKLTPSLLVKFDVSGVFIHELVLRVVPVAQPPSVQLEVSQENLCDTSDMDILPDFPVGYDGFFILWVVTGGLLLAALLVAALFWVCGSAPTPMPTSGVVCGRLNSLFFQFLAFFAAMLGLLRWFLAYCGKRIISRGHTKSSGNGRDLEGKNDWKAPLNFCPFIVFPVQVISYASSGILVAAAAFVTFCAKKMAFLSAAAFVLYYFGAAAASTAAAGTINANEGMFALVGHVLLNRPLTLVEFYFCSGSWCLQLRLTSLTHRRRLPWLQLRLSWCSLVWQLQTAVLHVQQL